MADAVEGVLTEVASHVDPMELPLVEVTVGVRLEFLFFFLQMSWLDFIY